MKYGCARVSTEGTEPASETRRVPDLVFKTPARLFKREVRPSSACSVGAGVFGRQASCDLTLLSLPSRFSLTAPRRLSWACRGIGAVGGADQSAPGIGPGV